MNEKKTIEDELYESYFKYARSVIEDRSLPHFVDGLKSVQRRILFLMHSTKMFHTSKFVKSVKVVGDVMGRYHPHGDSSIYQALVRMAQWFSCNIPFIESQGNFGSIDGDNAAAHRYTEAKLSKYSEEFFEKVNEVMQMKDNFDGTCQEPVFLPARVPNLLINGSQGIAIGISTSIPPHNLREVMEALVFLVDKPEATLLDVMDFIKGPDLPTGCLVSGPSEIYKAYETGEGNFVMRAAYEFEDDCIIFKEVPYLVKKADIMVQIAEGVKEGRIEGVSVFRDESNREGIRIFIKVKHGYAKEIVVNQIYASTSLKTYLRCCFFALNDKGEPKIYTLLDYLKSFLKFREDVVINRTTILSDKTKKRIQILIGLYVAIENMPEIMDIVTNSESVDEARKQLSKQWKCDQIKEYMSSFGINIAKGYYEFSPDQIKAILELKLTSLVKLERHKIEEELLKLRDNINYYNEILNSSSMRKQIIKEEFEEIIVKYKTPRRTRIENTFSKFQQRDLVVKEDIMIILDKNNYIKRVTLDNYKTQNKGGRGRIGSNEDVLESIIASTHSLLLVFTDTGRFFVVNCYEIPEGDHGTKGRAIINLINIEKDEKILKFLIIQEEDAKNPDGNYLIFVQKNGQVRRNHLSDFISVRSNGKKYISSEKIELVCVLACKEGNKLFMATHGGMALVTPIDEFRVFNSRDSEGVRGIKLKPKDFVVGALIVEKDTDLVLTVNENGIGKISEVADYRLTHRGGSGVINIKTEKGKVIGICNISKEDEVIIITQKSQFLRFAMKNIRVYGRNTSGLKLCNLTPGDKVHSIYKVDIDEDNQIENT